MSAACPKTEKRTTKRQRRTADDKTGALALKVSNADRVVFPEVGRTKGDVVEYYQKIAPKMLPHLIDRPVSIHRFPKGLADKGFFQKNVPAHFPSSIARFEIPRKGGVTVYPIVSEAEHLGYLANQGAIELHIPIVRASHLFEPDRLVIDLDPPPGAFELVRKAAFMIRDALLEYGLTTVPVATGSKGYHLVAAIAHSPAHDSETLAITLQQVAALLVAKYPDQLTTTFRVAQRGQRVFVDWLRNRFQATVVAPYSLRARAKATVAVPLSWDELATSDPDRFTIGDVDQLLDREDSLATLAKTPADVAPFVGAVARAFESSGLELETFDRFRS